MIIVLVQGLSTGAPTMSDSPHEPRRDTCRVCAEDGALDRNDLDRIFQAGVEARESGRSMHDNPYAAGSEERDEWAAGWNATPDLDADEEPGSPV